MKRSNSFVIYIFITFLFVLLPSLSHAQKGVGVRMAKESSALVLFAELGNIGARDPDFAGVEFPRTDIKALVDSEFVQPLKRVAEKENPTEADLVLRQVTETLLDIPYAKSSEAGARIVEIAYLNEKKKYIAQFGKEKAGFAFSVMIQTVIHQKKLALRQIFTEMQ